MNGPTFSLKAGRVLGLLGVFAALAALSSCAALSRDAVAAPGVAPGDWQTEFNLAKRELTHTGESKFFILKPGFRTTLASGNAKLIITVLDETKVIGGITTRVIEEREEKNGQLYEISRNFYAMDPKTGDAFYFGEEVDFYKDGKVTGHVGAWIAYEGRNKPGLIMPGTPKVGMKYYQEMAPGAAMDRAEVMGVSETFKTPAGEFKNALVTRESSQLEPAVERKTYAPGIGLIQDQAMRLVSYGYTTPKPIATNGVVPDSLLTIEAQTEDIIDIVPNADWSNVNADISAIEKAWATYQSRAAKDGATQAMRDNFTQVLARLKASSTSKDAPATLQAANDVSAVVVEMFELYHPAVPADIGRLDVLERQIIFDVANQNFTVATDTLAKINAVWERVRPSALAHDGKKAAEQFDKSLTAQAEALKAKDSTALTDEAKNGLEIVDALERVY